MRLSDGNRTRKKWEKPLGCGLIVFGYLLLAAGIAVACIPAVPRTWRILSPFCALILYLIFGAVGYFLSDVNFSGYRLQRKREWRESSYSDRLIYAVTVPHRLVLEFLNFFNP